MGKQSRARREKVASFQKNVALMRVKQRAGLCDKLLLAGVEDLNDAIRINAQNVYDYWVKNQSSRSFDAKKFFVCMTPPFESSFIEFRVDPGKANTSVGILCRRFDSSYHSDYVGHIPEDMTKGTKYGVQCFVFTQNSLLTQLPLVGATFFLTEEGVLKWSDEKEVGYSFAALYTNIAELPEVLAKDASALTWVAFTVFNFLHCKNVETIDQVPGEEDNKIFQETYGFPLSTYRTLKVNPMRTVKRKDGAEDAESSGNTHRLHIARGHFKDYRNGGGLFGKLKGLYWWDAHVRGDEAKGVVLKDYEVQSPEDKSA